MQMQNSPLGDRLGDTVRFNGSAFNLMFSQLAASIPPSFCAKIGYYHPTQNLVFASDKKSSAESIGQKTMA